MCARYRLGALALARELFNTDQFHNPFVTDDDDNTVWAQHELRERCTEA